jgi:hypothetical protein
VPASDSMEHSGGSFARAENYRVKAKGLRDMASEVNATLRGQLTDLASQYERLAARLERVSSPSVPANSD